MMKKLYIPKDTTIDILGVPYKIKFKNYIDDPDFKARNAAGFCNSMTKEISICLFETYPEYLNLSDLHKSEAYKELLRHEVLHAILYESGLANETHDIIDHGWALDEEIVDWFAIQSVKIYKIFNNLNIL